ncbi:importin subunit beta-1 [[Candida] anglica]|uniref:Importin subunit beta-1 n=1 Tax=[Candida] anglica TaxID=148631 RepID=A0ABP0ENC0_9ASCO
MDILQVLENALMHPDPAQRSGAEQQLNDAAANHFVDYLSLLTEALANDEAKTEVRMLAGIGLKNQLTSKDAKSKESQHQRWISLDAQSKTKIKETALRALMTSDDRVANSAAQLVAAIADIELPRSEWPELIPIIIENTKTENQVNVKRASLLTIGYICESADPNNPAIVSQSNGILIAIVQGVQASEPSHLVRLTALNALVNSLEFIRFNFEREGERNYIMQVVCEATQADNNEIQASAFGCLSRIMALYYQYMALYMEKALYGLTVSGMQSKDEKVACMAVEFWSSVCEEELEITLQREEYGAEVGEEYQSFNFALLSIQQVLPTLLNLLTRQNEDPEDDDWSVAMAAGACIQLFAQNTGSYVVQPTLSFVSENIQNSNSWNCREAAVMAFGSILDGPERDQLKELISQALPPILSLMTDEYLQVKETVAWCLGRIADLVVDAIDNQQYLPAVISALATGLQDHPKVSTNCCWTLMNLLEQLCPDGPKQETTVMSPFYGTLVPILVQLSGKNDNEYSSRASAYEALSHFVMYSAQDAMPIVQGVASEALSRLQGTVGMSQQQIDELTTEDKVNLEELQTNILSLLTNIIRRAGPDVTAVADDLMSMFLQLLNAQQQQQNGVIEEDVLIAISAVASSVGDGFTKYMDAFQPYLTNALVNTESPSCNIAIGLVADLSQALGQMFLPYLDGYINILGANLNNAEVKRELRPTILSCFGDISTSVGVHFEPYLQFVLQICQHASEIEPEDSSIETLDYTLNIKEGVLDAYVGIVGGFAEKPQTISPYLGQIFSFLQQVSVNVDMASTDSVCRAVVGLLGDIAAIYPNQLSTIYSEPWMLTFIKKTRANPMFQPATKETARWAREQQKRQLGQL